MKLIKSFFRWLVLGFTIFFIISNIYQNWRSLEEIKLTYFVWFMFCLSLGFNLFAHTFSAWVWTWILNLFRTKLQGSQAVSVYLITNISKYLPGNVWHFLGRVKAIQNQGDTLATATVSVIIEPLLMAIAALLITIISASLGILDVNFSTLILVIKLIIISGALISISPPIINPILNTLAKGKGSNYATKLTQYPLLPLGGELIFIILRGCAFLILLMAFLSLNWTLIPKILSVFSFSWLLGLIVPGAPGGLGIFEATVIATLDPTIFPREIVLIVVALFRISSILGEVITAYGAWLLQKVDFASEQTKVK